MSEKPNNHRHEHHDQHDQAAKKVRLCQCGEPAIVGVRKHDLAKYMSNVIPDLRRRELMCMECWCKWEDEHGHRRHASAVWIS